VKWLHRHLTPFPALPYSTDRKPNEKNRYRGHPIGLKMLLALYVSYFEPDLADPAENLHEHMHLPQVHEEFFQSRKPEVSFEMRLAWFARNILGQSH